MLVRIRPFLSNENDNNTGLNVDSENSQRIEISKSLKKFAATYDKVLSKESTQKEVFNFIKPCLNYIKKGINCTILAYGQTGSGKTYTMFGGEWALNDKSTDYENRKKFHKDKYNFILNEELTIDPFSKTNGIIPNLIMSLFQTYGTYGSNGSNIIITCSYIQIYNEQVYDLLIDEEEIKEEKKTFNLISGVGKNIDERPIKQKPLKIKYDKKNGVTIDGVNEIRTPTFYDIFELLRQGEINRKIRQTNRNEMSSRSHTIFIINIQNLKTNVVSKIKLCDLAGSERYDSREKYKKIHFSEMCNINKSLLVLGNVIHALGQTNTKANLSNTKNKKTFAPYKDSKLTQILEDSLGGNSVTYLIANISPNDENFEETVSTLKFADRAHSIMSQVSKNQLSNQDDDIRTKEYNKLAEELFKLKQLLNIRKKRGTLEPIQEELIKLKDENSQLKKYLGENNVNKIQELIKENNSLKKEIKSLKIMNKNLKNEINSKPNSNLSAELISENNNIYKSSEKKKLKLNNNNDISSNKINNLKYNKTNNDNLMTLNDYITSPKNNNENKISNSYIKNKNNSSKNNILLESGKNIIYGTKTKNEQQNNNEGKQGVGDISEDINYDDLDNNNNEYSNKFSKNDLAKSNNSKIKNQKLSNLKSNANAEKMELLDQLEFESKKKTQELLDNLSKNQNEEE